MSGGVYPSQSVSVQLSVSWHKLRENTSATNIIVNLITGIIFYRQRYGLPLCQDAHQNDSGAWRHSQHKCQALRLSECLSSLQFWERAARVSRLHALQCNFYNFVTVIGQINLHTFVFTAERTNWEPSVTAARILFATSFNQKYLLEIR